MIMTQSTITLQKIVNIAQSFGDIEPVLNVAGDSSNPALIIATDSLQQTLFLLPDQYETNFRQGFIAQCYRYSTEAKTRAKFKDEWQLWLASLNELRAKQDRELEENIFIPNRSIMGGGAVIGRLTYNGTFSTT